MESFVIELIKPITLEKENHTAKVFEEGTILKVLLKTPNSLLVSDDAKFSFTVDLNDEDIIWRKL
ncbi:hypothetical protein ACUM6W_10415 [Acinetobacter tandoii]|jgi:hypothetical protein|uniref:Uncharacterized protein n=1 Tax=Acinetobacter tandoii TaxID=202954 RepID=A0A5N4WAC0_9GAMM|nr:MULTISPECIES: hypothetical protein [Acinetobacter]AUX85222.1 hypothetical protein C3F34_03485 [Acinetobacter sp. ACNIH2]KAB1853336.1 hypothetical protein F4W09_12855 [Acinetobacter tandoii]UOG17028.1 hypothetical protein MP622_10960 [Acinetobacter sp. PK01]